MSVQMPRNQARALAALLEHRSIKAAAEACGLNERTIRRYLEGPEFRRALARAESDTIDEAGRRLLGGQDAALDALEELITGADNDANRRLAAVAWLDFALRWRELKNIEQRLTELEGYIYGEQTGVETQN